MRVVPELVVEERQLADRSIDEIGELRPIARIDVDLVRDEQLGRRIGELSQDGLAPYDDEIALVRDRGRSPKKNMLEVRALHELADHRLTQDALPRRRIERERKRARLSKRGRALGFVDQRFQQAIERPFEELRPGGAVRRGDARDPIARTLAELRVRANPTSHLGVEREAPSVGIVMISHAAELSIPARQSTATVRGLRSP